ncbi:MAG: type II toxin-antitoxin system RelB/DinJ family antitoxin [Patescibacteria group bacterium]
MSTTIQIRIDASTKTKAKKAFKDMGLDLSSGIKYLLTQVGDPKSTTYICPFGFMHKYTPKMLATYKKEAEQAIKHGKRYSSTKEMFDDMERVK